jgi:hypothetical protein
MSENDLYAPKTTDPPRPRIRLPGFITEREIGLGDLVKKVTYSAGIKPCGGCERRAAALNRWVTVGVGRR